VVLLTQLNHVSTVNWDYFVGINLNVAFLLTLLTMRP